MTFINNSFIKKFFVSTALIIGLSSTVHAHNFHNDSCSVNINGEIVLENNQATISSEQGDTIVLSQSGKVWVNDDVITLSSEQMQDVSDYVSGLQKVVPEAIELAAKAIEIANYAVTQVFTGLLGEGNSLSNLINEKLSYLQEKLEAHINQNPGAVTFNSAFFGGTDSGDGEFEQEVDAVIDDVLGEAAGQFLISLGQSILSGDGSMSNFEERMATVDDDIENAITEKSELLKDQALDVCATLKQVDANEAKLQNIPELKELNLINVANSSA